MMMMNFKVHVVRDVPEACDHLPDTASQADFWYLAQSIVQLNERF